MNSFSRLCFPLLLIAVACNQPQQKVSEDHTDTSFDAFTERFLDAYWKQNPSAAIYTGYGKYYELLKIPDSAGFAGDILFSKRYLDSLAAFEYDKLADKNKIDYKILLNQLRSTIWYIDTFKSQQWDASYNLGGECYEIIDRNFAPLHERLKILSQHLQHADRYYSAALQMMKEPMKEYAELAIRQNEGGLEVFGSSLTDSILASALTEVEKDTLNQRIGRTTSAMRNYTASLKKMVADKNYSFRNFRIGENLFHQKFKYDIVTDYSPKEIFDKAVAAKNSYHHETYGLANDLWAKYCGTVAKPSDSLLLIKMVIDRVSLHHASPGNFIDTIKNQVRNLERFIIQKNLFQYDTAYPLEVRIMPAYMSGVSLASASQPLPYQKNTVTYYNVSDLTKVSPDRAESQLRENNDYMLSILSIHEAIPGHCLQGVYNSKSPDMVKAVFVNGAMVEGWAVYCERMMLENGWGNDSPELWLMFYKWSLRECCNVIIDYGLHCLNYSKEDVVRILKDEAFQEDAQIEEKYHRATVSQVQLCTYFTGGSEIRELRDAYQKKKGDQYSLLDFHEKFLRYGSAPVKFIGELMLAE